MHSFIQDHYHKSPWNGRKAQRQRDLWQFLTNHRHERTLIRHCIDALGYSSKSLVWNDLRALEAAGYIRTNSLHTGIKVLIPLVDIGDVNIRVVTKVDPYRAQRELERWLFGGIPERDGRR